MEQKGIKKQKMRLRSYHHEAIEQCYLGKTYRKIAEYLNEKYTKTFTRNTISKWFMRNGFLEKEYLDFSRKESERRRRFVIEEMKKIISMIPEKYIEIIGRDTKNLDPKTLIKRDTVTLRMLKDLCTLLGFRIDISEDEPDPLDVYFDQEEKKIENEGQRG